MKPGHVTALGLAALLAACGQKTETNEGSPAGSATEAGMGDMTVPAESGARMAKGTGTVMAVDKSAGTITLDHAPIPEVNWPAMTMAFEARPELLDSVKAGDKVTFDLTLRDDAGELTAITKQ